MRKHDYKTYDEFLEAQRKRSAEWYQANKEWKKHTKKQNIKVKH